MVIFGTLHTWIRYGKEIQIAGFRSWQMFYECRSANAALQMASAANGKIPAETEDIICTHVTSDHLYALQCEHSTIPSQLTLSQIILAFVCKSQSDSLPTFHTPYPEPGICQQRPSTVEKVVVMIIDYFKHWWPRGKIF